MPTKPRATQTPKVKTTYTFGNITFSTSSKVVAKMAASGNMRAAYNRYISDTVGRAMRGTDMSKAVRAQWRHGLADQILSEAEARAAVKAYKKQVQQNIGQNIKAIYGDVYDQLRDMDTRAAKKLIREIDNIIAKYSWAYDVQESYEMNQEIQTAIEKFKEENAGELSESDMDKILKVESSFGSTKEQYEGVVAQKLEKMAQREAAKAEAGKG